MALKPGNPVVGGTVLRRAAIQSPNFQESPLEGWAIDQDGNAYFESLVIGGGVVRVTFSDTAPSDPNDGDIWFDLANGTVLYWDGSAWTNFQYGTNAIQDTAITTDKVDFVARDIGGITTTIAATAPSGAQNGDLWFDSSNEYKLNQYESGTWSPYQFGTGAIAAGSITAALIAANTITATELAAGIVYAGIVDGTTISAATFEGTNYIARSNGAWWYSSTPAAGNLSASITDASRTDGFGNVTPAGGGFCTYDTANGRATQYSKSGITFYTGSLSGGWVVSANSSLQFDGANVALNAAGSVTLGGILVLDLVYAGLASVPLRIGASGAPAGTASDIEIANCVGIHGRSAPATPPSGMGYLYVNSSTHALHYKGPSGTDTQIASG